MRLCPRASPRPTAATPRLSLGSAPARRPERRTPSRTTGSARRYVVSVPHFLLKSQQNEVFRAIQECEFDPADFKWQQRLGEVQFGPIPVLVHSPTGGEFAFDFDDEENTHWAVYSPGSERPTDKYAAGGWTPQLRY